MANRTPPPWSPAWLSPRDAALLVSALASVILADIAVVQDYTTTPWAVIACALVAAIGGWAAAERTLRRGAFLGIAARTGAGCGAVSGMLLSILGHLEHPISASSNPGGWLLDLVSTAAISVIGAIVGALFGLTALAALRPAARAAETPSLDGLERVLLPASAWIALVSWLALCVHHGRVAFGLTGTSVAALLLLLIPGRDLRRVLWLRAVAAGKVPGWTIVPCEADDAQVPMFGPYAKAELDGALVRVREPRGAAAFREAAAMDVVALLPLEPSRARAPFVRRAALGGLAAAGMAWLMLGGPAPHVFSTMLMNLGLR